MSRGVTLETLGDLIDGGHSVAGYCGDCHHGADLDLAVLAAKLGRNWVYIRKRWPIRCSVCGSSNTSIRIAVAGRPGMGGGSSSHE